LDDPAGQTETFAKMRGPTLKPTVTNRRLTDIMRLHGHDQMKALKTDG
jgi:hypothetical protein